MALSNTVITKNYSNHSIEKPNENPLLFVYLFRMLITGPSNCGKTNLLLNIIDDSIEWERLYICAKYLEEASYKKLIKKFNDFSGVSEDDIRNFKTTKSDRLFLLSQHKLYFKYSFFSNNLESFITANDLDHEYRNLVVFDDFVLEKKQEIINEFFFRGRKKNASIIYLSQKYYKVPKEIRDNCNYFIFLKIDSRDLKRIVKEFDNEELDSTVLGKYDCYVIDKNPKDKKMRYQINFNPYLNCE